MIFRVRKNIILMYHRIDDPPVDPWGLCVAPAVFAAQMEVLARLGVGCRLADVQKGSGRVAVTFDDGYADNLYQAKPVLEALQIPATVFVVTGAVGSEAFWWDQLEVLLLRNMRLPEQPLRLRIEGRDYSWSVRTDEPAYTGKWIAWRDEPPTSRHLLFREIWQALRGIDHAARARHLSAIGDWARNSGHCEQMRPMTQAELQLLREGGLVELGAHTVTHSRLSALSQDGQRDEIAGSRDRIREISGQATLSFSFPFGGQDDYTPATRRLLRDAGFERACTTEGTAVTRRSDPLRLPRFHVENWGAEQFSDWLTRQLT